MSLKSGFNAVPYSIGTDIVDVARIRRSVKNKKFIERVYTVEEINYCRKMKNSAQHFAVRFAAKEAVWKALSGMAIEGIGHREIGVFRLSDGRPIVQFSQRLKKFEKYITLSLSHTKEYAVAVALFFKK